MMQPGLLDLFCGAAGGWSLGMHRAGFRTIAACELIPWRRVLFALNNPGVTLYDDVRELTAARLVRELGWLPDAIVGSPPCQDISSANTQGKGVDGERSGLYFEAVRLVDECRPRWFSFENSANLRTRGADRLVAAFQAVGYAVELSVVGADDVKANHERKRSWFIGYDPDQVTDPCGWQLRQQPRRSSGPNRTHQVLDGDDDQAIAVADAGLSIAGGRDQAGGRIGSKEETAGIGSRRVLQQWAQNGHASKIGRGTRRPGRRAVAIDGLPVEACLYPFGTRNTPDPDQAGQAGQADGCMVAGIRQEEIADDGCGDVGSHDVAHADCDGQPDGAVDAEMGWGESSGGAAGEPWPHWNGGLAHHLRVDDGLSPWVAGSRIAIGGPRGTVAASLIVEAFGDAVLPQITEAIGRSILRTDAALRAIYCGASAIPQPQRRDAENTGGGAT